MGNTASVRSEVRTYILKACQSRRFVVSDRENRARQQATAAPTTHENRVSPFAFSYHLVLPRIVYTGFSNIAALRHHPMRGDPVATLGVHTPRKVRNLPPQSELAVQTLVVSIQASRRILFQIVPSAFVRIIQEPQKTAHVGSETNITPHCCFKVSPHFVHRSTVQRLGEIS